MVKIMRVYASMHHPLLTAIANGWYSFSCHEDAQKVLKSIRDKFIISKLHSLHPVADSTRLTLWVKDYALSPEQISKGFQGNFMLVRIASVDTRTTLVAEKLEIAAQYHPQRLYHKQKHPNWGHPVLRSIRKKHVYASLAEATKDLHKLLEDFPDVSLASGSAKLSTMIYERGPTGSGVKKYTLEIKKREDGFQIEYEEKLPEKRLHRRGEGRGENAVLGEFTAKTLLKKGKKRVHKQRHPKPEE